MFMVLVFKNKRCQSMLIANWGTICTPVEMNVTDKKTKDSRGRDRIVVLSNSSYSVTKGGTL